LCGCKPVLEETNENERREHREGNKGCYGGQTEARVNVDGKKNGSNGRETVEDELDSAVDEEVVTVWQESWQEV